MLEWATGVAGDKLITCYMHDVKNTMQLRELNTGAEVHKFPLDIGSVTGFSGDIRCFPPFMFKRRPENIQVYCMRTIICKITA